MAHDPFKPPQVPLEVEEELVPVPMRVKLAVVAIITGAVMSFALKAAVAFGRVGLPRDTPVAPSDMLPAAVPLLVIGFLAWKIFVGRDWARWMLGALVGLGMIGLAMILYGSPEIPTPVSQSLRVAGVIQLALNLVAFVLLFTGDAGAWFRR